MGDCRYCHTKAGLFKDAHSTCIQDAEIGRDRLRSLITETISSDKTLEVAIPLITSIAQTGRLSEGDARAVMLEAADKAAFEIAIKQPISNAEAERIWNIFVTIDGNWASTFTGQISNWPGYSRLDQSNTLYQVLHGEVPYYDPRAYADLRFQKGEHPVIRRNATLAEYRTISSGGYGFQSVRLPIGAGMYYRIGSSQPHTKQSGLMPIDEGNLVITTKAILFTGQRTNFRIDYGSILRIESFVDGFGIHENYGAGKVFIPYLIGTADEGWYFYNLVSALSKW